MTIDDNIDEYQILTVGDLRRACATLPDDSPVIAVYRRGGETVLEDIVSWCCNGDTLQLNPKDFATHLRKLRIKEHESKNS